MIKVQLKIQQDGEHLTEVWTFPSHTLSQLLDEPKRIDCVHVFVRQLV